MSSSVARALTKTVAAVAVVGLVATGPAAIAKPPVRPGTPTDLAVAIAAAASGGGYQLDSTWKSGTNTTYFKVAVTNSVGTVLDSETVSTLAWSALAKAPAGATLSLSVTPFNGTRKGPSVSKSVVAPDVTAPTGSYTGSDDAFVGTIHQDALADDLTATSAITRTVDWADGTVVTWKNGTDLTHTYAAQGRYVASVTLADQAGNERRIEVPIVINDHTAPAATYSLAAATGWAKLTPVVLNEDTISDDFSPVATLTRVVAWGDGTQSTWTGGTIPTHVYRAAGTYTPQVTVTDEAGNVAPATSAGATTITADVVGPTVRLSLPSKRKRSSAASWKLLKGTATDAGVGVAKVNVRAVEKRTRGWYAYVPAGKKWVRAGTTQAAAFKKAGAVVATLDATGHWAAPLAKVALGKLVYRVAAADRVGNAAKVITQTQAITRR